MEKKQYTEMQQKFLDVLFTPEVKGDLVRAKEAAGYSMNTSTQSIVEPLLDEINRLTKNYIASTTTKAAYSLYETLDGSDDPLGRKERIAVAKDLLDRGGQVKTDKVEVSGNGGLFILPAKDDA